MFANFEPNQLLNALIHELWNFHFRLADWKHYETFEPIRNIIMVINFEPIL